MTKVIKQIIPGDGWAVIYRNGPNPRNPRLLHFSIGRVVAFALVNTLDDEGNVFLQEVIPMTDDTGGSGIDLDSARNRVCLLPPGCSITGAFKDGTPIIGGDRWDGVEVPAGDVFDDEPPQTKEAPEAPAGEKGAQ